MLKIAVLAGGASNERQVSERSGAAVAIALKQKGYLTELFDTASPKFTLQALRNFDVVFIALHGAGGEDGSLQKDLERNRLTFVGSNSASSSLCFNKYRYSKLLAQNNISQPATEFVNFAGFAKSALCNKAFVLKPHQGGSSIGLLIARHPHDAAPDDVKRMFRRYPKLLLQQFINGLEITVGVIGDQALPVVEIIPPHNELFDYENKYNGATTENCPPEKLSPELQTKAQQLALKIHRLAGCQDMSRTDMIVTNKGQIYVLETNTIPGLTSQSLVPKAAAAAGLPMPELCSRLVETAYKRQATVSGIDAS